MSKNKTPTKAELRLLRYPPTPETWVCGCTMVNAGSRGECVFCSKKKPKKPKRLWPMYVKACKKVGVNPEERKTYKPVKPK